MASVSSSSEIVDDILKKQRENDKRRRELAEAIVEGRGLKTIEEAKQFAKNWIETAAQHADNESYWRDRALLAEQHLERSPEKRAKK